MIQIYSMHYLFRIHQIMNNIRYNIISKNISKRIGTHDGACHKLDIINQYIFLSCSEDGTRKLMDMRDN